MNTEYEVRVLEINHEEIIEKLESVGAKLIFKALQRRYVYDFNPIQKNRWIRLRTNGKKTTLTIKSIDKLTVDGTKELEIEVSDFDKTNQILNFLGYKPRGDQENYRVEYRLDDTTIELDKWPKIPEFMEIEGKDEESIKKVLDKLKIDQKQISTLDVESIYIHYGYKKEDLNSLKMEENDYEINHN